MLKIYAINNYIPFDYNIVGMSGKFTDYYLTEQGLTMFYDFFKSHSFAYCRSMFSNLFVRATAETLQHPEDYAYFNNFRGVSGKKVERGTKQRAMIIRKVNRCERKYEFDSIKEARQTLTIWLTMYPIEEFTLYRIRTQKGTTFKEKIPLIVEHTGGARNMGKTDWREI